MHSRATLWQMSFTASQQFTRFFSKDFSLQWHFHTIILKNILSHKFLASSIERHVLYPVG
nr:MAG TPA: hypothetical protein [Caudoviricetes sp.]